VLTRPLNNSQTYDEPPTRNVPKSLAKFFFREFRIRIRIFSANKSANTKRVYYAGPVRAIRPNSIWLNLIHSVDSFRMKRFDLVRWMTAAEASPPILQS
jgi:hypothetical protein